ncbi:MAG: hypothetical protein AB3N63_05330 [Puniceicoccaceae bacterium]
MKKQFTMRYIHLFLALMVTAQFIEASGNGVDSIDTGLTVMKVRSAADSGEPFIVGGSYEGIVIRAEYDGTIEWKRPLSGYMIHDIWCQDINGDNCDEILVANADGMLYCIDSDGIVLWKFKPNDSGHLPPMYAVCVIRDEDGTPWVVCGGFDYNIYYLSNKGQLVKTIPSSGYSNFKTFAKKGKMKTPEQVHAVNFLRPLPQPDGSDILFVHAMNNHMQTPGAIYQFKPLQEKPFYTLDRVDAPSTIGDLHITNADDTGKCQVLLGTSKLGRDSIIRFDPETGDSITFKMTNLGAAGYRVAQAVTIPDGSSYRYFMMAGTHILLLDPDFGSEQRAVGKYAFNDIWRDSHGRVLLASNQSGGSCIHVINTSDPGWEQAFANLNPPGKIERILRNSDVVRSQIKNFRKPAWQRDALPVYLTWANKKDRQTKELIEEISAKYDSPIFLNSASSDKEKWDRSGLDNELFRNKRDKRMKYTLTQQEVLDNLLPSHEGAPGIAYWVGHGNDPYMFQLSTTKKVLDGAKGNKTVMILPEMEESAEASRFVINDLVYPIAEHAAKTNANLFMRSKNVFWSATVYEDVWADLIAGKYAKSIVPSMEETTDNTPELSLSGRIGLWAGGAVDSWGMRCSRDNPSFDRARQHSYQRLPNHFLRAFVYRLAMGAQYVNNTYVDQYYMSVVWELVAKGALYVPKRSEIVSFSPVHVSMTHPDHDYINQGTNTKWTNLYDLEFEKTNTFVFGRLHDAWMASPVNDWDFSSYAANVRDRRQNFLPPFNSGMVLITPPQSGVFADDKAPRGRLEDHLHPMYRGILKEFITDGRHYYSADGNNTYGARAHVGTVRKALEQGKRQLPVSVDGEVAWVVAQVAPKTLRLTLVDSGYLNPGRRSVKVHFHTVNPVGMTDILSGESFDARKSELEVEVPCGLFRFFDIQLTEPL